MQQNDLNDFISIFGAWCNFTDLNWLVFQSGKCCSGLPVRDHYPNRNLWCGRKLYPATLLLLPNNITINGTFNMQKIICWETFIPLISIGLIFVGGPQLPISHSLSACLSTTLLYYDEFPTLTPSSLCLGHLVYTFGIFPPAFLFPFFSFSLLSLVPLASLCNCFCQPLV